MDVCTFFFAEIQDWDGMGWLSICSNLGLSIARSQPHDVQGCPSIMLLPTLFFFFWKHPLSRELDSWTDTRAINPRKPPDQSNGLFGGCTQWRSADETDFSKENLPLHRVAVSHGEEMCWKLAVFFFLCLFFFFLFYFEGLGGDKPEMKHFILVSLTW